MVDYAIPLVQGLKKAGFRVYFLSNYSRKAYDECGESLIFMPYMDGGLVSFKVGMTKPDPKMYQMFLEEYALRAEECVFIDDTAENVEAARQIGFKGIVFTSYEELQTELEKLGINDDYLKNEPYVVEGVWKKIEIETMNVVLVNGERRT